MKILAIDSSGLVASAAVVSDEAVIAEFTVNNKQTHSQTLLPMIDQVVQFSGIALEELDALAVAAGPGSFTGLRIGASTVKGMGLALDKPVVPVPALEGMAYQLAESEGWICPIMDARRNQVYTGIYYMEGGQLRIRRQQYATDIRDLLEDLEKGGQTVHFLGDGVPIYREMIEEGLSVPFSFAPPHLARQRAAAVAMLACRYYREGKTETAAEHKPIYLRKSQAERERERRMQEEG